MEETETQYEADLVYAEDGTPLPVVTALNRAGWVREIEAGPSTGAVGEIGFATGHEHISFMPGDGPVDVRLVGKVVEGIVRTDIAVLVEPDENVLTRKEVSELIERLTYALQFFGAVDA